MSSLARKAGLKYAAATALVTAAAVRLAMDIAQSRGSKMQLRHKILGVVLFIAGLFSQTRLRDWFLYFRKMDQNGCGFAPMYPNDPTGFKFLMASAKALNKHALLDHRLECMRTLGITYINRGFPDRQLAVTTTDPENLKAVLSSNFEDWAIPQARIDAFMPVFGAHSIFSVNGAEWQHARAGLRPAFVRNQISDMQCLNLHISKLIKRIPTNGDRFDLQAYFSMLTIDSITDFMFGQSTDILGTGSPEGVKFGQCFDDAMYKVGRRSRLGWITSLIPDKEFNEQCRYMKEYVERYISEVRQKNMDKATSDISKYVFLNELIKSNEPNDVIRDLIFSVFIAGRDTTTSVLTYLFYELSRRSDVVSKIQSQIREQLGENTSHEDLTWDQLKNLTYLQWTIKEALRLHPPVPTNAREAVRDTILPRGGGPDGQQPLFVSKGWHCKWQAYLLHRRPELYGDDADEFRPERWEDLRVTWEYLPWNGGPRICIGQQFATTQIALVTYRLLTAFERIGRRDDREVKLKMGINISFLDGCWVEMTPREGAKDLSHVGDGGTVH